MKELDFDELDRAVNTLMGGVSSSVQAPKSIDDDTRTITIPSTLSGTAMPVMPAFSTDAATPAAQPASTAEVTPPARTDTPIIVDRQTTPSVAQRRSGRFMDVVHPSSDMKNPSNDRQSMPTRTGPTLQPITPPSPVVEEIQPAPSEVVIAQTPEVVEFAQSAIEPATSADTPFVEQSAAEVTSEWPDPLADFTLDVPTIVTPAELEATVAEALNIAPVSVVDEADDDDDLFTIDSEEHAQEPEPQTSPFLADAKVEKRPLGSATSDELTTTDESDFEHVSLTQANPESQLPANAVPTEVPLPAELQSDLIAVESDTTEGVSVAAATVQSNPAQPTVASTGPTSIQQQYTEAKTSGDQTNGSIYDTDAYHKPLAHPIKKKSGWMWIIWVVIILLVGAGGGAALYLSGTI